MAESVREVTCIFRMRLLKYQDDLELASCVLTYWQLVILVQNDPEAGVCEAGAWSRPLARAAASARQAGETVASRVLPGGKDEAQRLDAGGLAASIATLLFSLPALGATHHNTLLPCHSQLLMLSESWVLDLQTSDFTSQGCSSGMLYSW